MFDVEQCKKDGWRCEVMEDGKWTQAENIGVDRDGDCVVVFNPNKKPWPTKHIRNVQKPKIKRATHFCTVPAGRFFDGHIGEYSVTVPLITDAEGHPIVDHSDAVLDVLGRLELACRNVSDPNHAEAWHLIKAVIDRIKRERGELWPSNPIRSDL